MLGFVTSFATPAIVAGVVTWLINNKGEKVRAKRDFVTKTFDPSRDDVRRAVDAALAYYPLSAADRTKLLEAKILAAERDVRHSLTALLEMTDNTSAPYGVVEGYFDEFIDALTGGSFQSATATPDLATALRVADAGAHLRASLLALRSHHLDTSISNDPLTTVSGMWGGVMRSIGRQ